jgi:hypothetical protein
MNDEWRLKESRLLRAALPLGSKFAHDIITAQLFPAGDFLPSPLNRL